MDLQKWLACEWSSLDEYKEFEGEIKADLEAKLAGTGFQVVKILPNNWQFSAVVANDENTKWIHVTTADVREGAQWAENIKLRRMSSERDWKGDEFHFGPWAEIAALVEKYMGSEYDEEAF